MVNGGEGGMGWRRESGERKARLRQRLARVPGTLPLIGTRAKVWMVGGDTRSLSGWITALWPCIHGRGPQDDPSEGVEDSLHSLSLPQAAAAVRCATWLCLTALCCIAGHPRLESPRAYGWLPEPVGQP